MPLFVQFLKTIRAPTQNERVFHWDRYACSHACSSDLKVAQDKLILYQEVKVLTFIPEYLMHPNRFYGIFERLTCQV